VAHEKFTAEVLTPEGSVFKDEVEMVSTRTSVGSIGILAKHQPLLGMLEPTELRLYRSDSDIVRLAQGEGYVQVSREGVLLLVQDAEDPSSLNVSDLQDRLRRAEEAERDSEEGSEERRQAVRDRKRWKAFIDIAEGGS
jgi:F-type H+-transporting ATPase subunit epsilon